MEATGASANSENSKRALFGLIVTIIIAGFAVVSIPILLYFSPLPERAHSVDDLPHPAPKGSILQITDTEYRVNKSYYPGEKIISIQCKSLLGKEKVFTPIRETDLFIIFDWQALADYCSAISLAHAKTITEKD